MGIVIRQSLKGTFVNYVGVILGIFVQFYIVTKYIDPTVIGLTKVIYEIAFLCSGLAMLGLPSSGMRFFPFFKNKENGNNGFLFYFLLIPTIGTVIVSTVYVLLKRPLLGYFSEKSPEFSEFFYWVVPFILILTFWQVFENYANINMRIAVPKAIREIGMRLFMLAIYLLYAFHYIDVAGLVAGFLMGYGLCFVCTGVYSLHIGSRTLKHDWSFIKPDLRKNFLNYTGFLVIANVSGNIMSQLDSFMLSGVKGMYSVGIYTIVLYMAEVVNMPSRNITPISAPLAAEAMKNEDIKTAQDLYKQVSVHQCLATACLLLIVWANLDNIYAVIPNGEIFSEGRWAVLYLGLSKLIYGTLNFGNTLISYSKYYYWTLFITIFLTILTICTNLYFIPRLGLSGAALATLITCVISYSYQQYIVQIKLKANPFSWRHLRIVAMLCILFAFNYFIPSMRESSPWLDIVVRTTLICVPAIVMVYYFKISPQINWFIRTKILGKKE
ncbi:MAG: lipopolysaccharide biosynthesis protein [Bacteroidales bacterium]|nr:lipopolysaccharide biosynthesis protein [Bacteroidales bacterium]